MKVKTARQSILPKSFLLLLLLLLVMLSAPSVIDLFQKEHPFGDQANSSLNISDPSLSFLQEKSTFEEVLDFFKEKTIFLSVNDEASNKMTRSFRKKMKAIGGEKLSELAFQNSYVGIVKDGRIINEDAGDSLLEMEYEDFVLGSGGSNGGNKSYLKKGREYYEVNNRGLNVYVADENDVVIGTYNFDFYQEKEPKVKGRVVASFSSLLDKVEIVIKEDKYQKLARKRKETLKTKVLITGANDFVPARIHYKNGKHKGEVRLKGDWTDHLEGEQWSFRVKLNGGEALKGMRKFSLHHPRTRNYAGEWLFQQLLHDEDILNLQYHFVRVELTIQGEFESTTKELGVYALEEFFDKYLIERQQRRESVILKIDEDPLWQERADIFAKGLELSDLNYIKLSEYENLNILPFGTGKVLQDSSLMKSFRAGKAMFKGYIDRQYKISEVFDVERMAKYNALCNVLGGNHALLAHNFRAYYNPINGLLEPVGFDANAGMKEWYFLKFEHAEHDLEFMEAYVRALEEVTSDEYYQKIINWPGLSDFVTILESTFMDYKWQPQHIDHNRKIIQQQLHPSDALNIFFMEMEGDYVRLDVENYGKFPVVITGLKNDQNRVFAIPAEKAVIMPGKKEIVSFKLAKNYQRLFVNKKKHKIGFNSQKDIPGLKVTFQTLGSAREKEENIIPWRDNYLDVEQSNLFRYASNITQFRFLEIDDESRQILCKKGNWKIDKPLVIPKGYTFMMGPGARIDLVNFQAKIVSYSAVRLEGTKENPAEILSSTGEGQGVIVMNVKDTSIVSNCKFTNLAEPKTKAWGVTGAVNFYDAPVYIYNSSFSDNRCEDGLNIFKTHFEMDNVVFSNTQSDAFDGDFVTGTIRNSIFKESGNDAIDVSGSVITIDNVTILNSGDKGLSAGEGSVMVAENIIIKNGEIAVASKDNSTVDLTVALLENNKLAFTAFQKKPEFGPATITAASVDLKNNGFTHLIEKLSALTLNGTKAETVEVVKERMYGIEFGKESEH